MINAKTMLVRMLRLCLLALGLFLASHVILTGTVPVVFIESLKRPIKIQKIDFEYLIGKQGQKIVIPHILQLPTTNIVFRQALSRGVEIDAHGNVYGLLRIDTGTTALTYIVRRINLSALVATLDPDLIDTSMDSEMVRLALDKARRRNQEINTYSGRGWSIYNLPQLELVEQYCFSDMIK